MNVCPNCGNAILGHPKECSTCKFNLEKFELLTEEEQNKFREYKIKENPDIYKIKPIETTQTVKKENPYEEEFNSEDTYCIAVGIFSLAVGLIAGSLFGVLGGSIGFIAGTIGLNRSIDASKKYDHEYGIGFILSLLGTIFSGFILFGAIIFGTFFGLAGETGHAAKSCINGCTSLIW